MEDEPILEQLDVLQADLDDESPEVLAAVAERLLAEGALDAHLSPLLMKKGRPGTRIEVLCYPRDRGRFVRLLLTETSTLGVKARRVERYSLAREFREVPLLGQTIRIKVARLDGRIVKASAEFEDCRRVAEKTGHPIREILELAKKEASIFLPE